MGRPWRHCNDQNKVEMAPNPQDFSGAQVTRDKPCCMVSCFPRGFACIFFQLMILLQHEVLCHIPFNQLVKCKEPCPHRVEENGCKADANAEVLPQQSDPL